jgi:dTDP-4-dehydrorhamnose reductase
MWITGAAGLVGSTLLGQAVDAASFDRIVAFTHAAPAESGPAPVRASVTLAQLGIGEREAVQRAARAYPPTMVINAAAIADPDTCEVRRDEAWRVNADGPRHLAEVCRASGAKLVHISTDYVFPGAAAHPGPYGEAARPQPINWYGHTKLAGERAAADVCGDDAPCAVVRTALVYGASPGVRRGFVRWLLGELAAARHVRIAVDQYNTPTVASDLAATLLWIAAHDVTGTYHASGPDWVTRQQWAQAIASHFGLALDPVEWVTTAELAQVASRPERSGLSCARLQADQAHGAPVHRGIEAGLRDFDWHIGSAAG